jgi:hypothetical protein
MLMVKVSNNFSWILDHSGTSFTFAGVQNKKVTNLYLVPAHSKATNASVREEDRA